MSGVTLHDVATAAGVHPSTVSRALDPARVQLVSEATRRRVVDAAERLGYRPDLVARGLKRGRTATVGVIAADLGNPFVTPLLHGIAAALEPVRTLPLIAETQDDHHRFERILDHMLSRRVDAVITTAARTADRAMLEDAARHTPIVVAARALPGSTLPQAVHDDVSGADLAATHLVELGHRRVAQLRGPLDVANFAQRAEGFSARCARAGVFEVPVAEIATRPVYAEGRRLMRSLLASADELPTAVFPHNDLMALGALAALEEAGIGCPDEISVIGYNDTDILDRTAPALTSISYPSRQVGEAAGRMAIALTEGSVPVESVTLPPTLVVRASTGLPRIAMGSATLD